LIVSSIHLAVEQATRQPATAQWLLRRGGGVALVETAASHRGEQALLEADEDDRAEMLAVARIMESLRAPE